MESNAGMIVRVLKRLKAAVGYHELGMTQAALRCLDGLASLGKIGPFGLVQEVLRGEFVKDCENRVSATKALEIVAFMLPMPARHAITMTLAAVSVHSGDDRAGRDGVMPCSARCVEEFGRELG
jgi:hypothetical protein